MRRATVTIPDDLATELDCYLAEQATPPTFTTLVQAALRDYLRNRRLQERAYRPPKGRFHIDPLEEKDDLGEPDVSVNHDVYFGEV